MVSVLAELTDEEAQTGSNSFSCLDHLHIYSFLDDCTRIRYDILQKAPKFAMACNISRVIVCAKGHTDLPLAELLLPLTKLNSISLFNLSNCHLEGLLTVLKSKGHQLKDWHLCEVSQFISLHDIVRTCPSLRKLTLNYSMDYNFDNGSSKNQEKQLVKPIDLPLLNELESIKVTILNKQICPSEVLDALLVSPSLRIINLTAIETLSTDSMFNLLSCFSMGSPALTSVKDFR